MKDLIWCSDHIGDRELFIQKEHPVISDKFQGLYVPVCLSYDEHSHRNILDSSTIKDQIMMKWTQYREKDKNYLGKRLYYLSVEFLTGRSLQCNALNLCSKGVYADALRELGVDWRRIIREEPEPGLGNGGLGRLAACFMDSLASLNIPAMGCTIRYEMGFFRQKLMDGQQVELPDNWLENGNVWEVASMEDTCEVHFGGWLEEKQEDDE